MYEPNFRHAPLEAGAVAVATPTVRGFWRRQFADAATPAQRKFDATFGIILPVLCFFFDPVVFREWHMEDGGIYERWQSYTYTVCTLEMVALAAWLLRPRGTAGLPPAALGGVLFAGGLFSLVVGVAILPLSLLGLIFLAGVFGFTPFPTAVVYLRSGWRAAALGRSNDDATWRNTVEFALGFVFALGAPALTRLWILFD
ncbi:MAG: hypothetical protein LC795_00265 [Acidobacteria bacterium]|nr:hypothetical protein [Acidobacteriota bacterium]